jgi:hypothetical protein
MDAGIIKKIKLPRMSDNIDKIMMDMIVKTTLKV